jgi:hypothetical protein
MLILAMLAYDDSEWYLEIIAPWCDTVKVENEPLMGDYRGGIITKLEHQNSNACVSIEKARANADRIASLWNAADGMTTEEAVRWLKGEIFGFNPQQLTHILTLATRLGYEEAVRYLTHGREMVEWLDMFTGFLEAYDKHPHKTQVVRSLLAKLEGK